jgi:mitofilin
LIYLFLATGLAYAGGVWYSLRSDNFHDFFTEYIPFGEEAVLYLEERDFRRRFPNATGQIHRRPSAPRDGGTKVTIASKSGLTSRVSEGQQLGTNVSRKERDVNAVDASKPERAPEQSRPADESLVTEKAREDIIREGNESQQGSTFKPVAEETPKQEARTEETKVQFKEEPREAASPTVTTVELLKINDGDVPVVQDLVKIFNDMIAVISADESAAKFSDTISKVKDEISRIGERINTLRNDAHAAAQEEIKQAHSTFDKSAAELIRRIDEVRAEEAAQFREEFEAERERLAQSYQEKIKTELERTHEVAEQRLRNELVEQAIELNRKFLSDVRSLVEKERDGRLGKLSELASKVSELENLTSDWNSVIDTNLKTQQLQVAVDAVRSALDGSDTPKPFVRELVAVKELASDDPVVAAAIASIDPTAYQRGIPSSAQIVDRFRRVANEVRKASLLPEDAGIASHAASFLLSKIMFKKHGLADGDDVESILTRTENYLEEGNLDEAAREINTLHGWAKLLSKDWLADVRRVLEVRQALEVRILLFRNACQKVTDFPPIQVIETEARLRCLQVE